MDFRQYDPAIGRFYSIDKMADIMPSLTPYRFGFNNPVMWSDPTGLFENGGGGDDEDVVYSFTGPEVVVGPGAYSSSSTPSFNYSLIDWSKVDNNRRPTIAQYNKHHGTNYQSFDDYYNNVYYKPALKRQTQAIHNSTGQAAKVCAVVAATLTGTAYLMPLVIAASPAIESTIATIVTNPTVQQKALDVSLNVGSQLWVNGRDISQVNLAEATMSAVNGPGATVLGEMVNININSISEGNIFERSSALQTGSAVAGGIGSYAFGEATDTYLKGTGTKGKIIGMYFKFLVESASNAAPNLVPDEK